MGDGPEELEQRSWKAWWSDDAPAVFDLRERAYRLYRARGDAAGAARMATWLAIDELDFRGAEAIAGVWLSRAHRLLDALQPLPEHGWLAFDEGFIAHASGDTAAARDAAARTEAIGRRFDIPDLQMLGLALEGATLVACADVAPGMRLLDEATAMALEGEATIPISAGWTLCFLVSACTAAHDFDRAFEWCDRIADFARRHGSRYMRAACRGDYGTIHMWRGDWARAAAMLEGSASDYARSRPALAGPSLAALAELRRRQGRLPEAERLLRRAGENVPSRLCRALIALDNGDPLEAAETLQLLLRHVPAHRALDRVPALAALVQAHVALGNLAEAAALVAELRSVEQVVGTEPLRAHADLAEGVLAAAARDHALARPLLEDAVHRFTTSGAPYETALARAELAKTLAALGRADAAAREAAAAAAVLRELGAAAAEPADITPREQEVLALLADGLTNRQIAQRLVVSEHTVHRHVTNILRKLELPSRTAAAAHAIRSGHA